MKELGYTEKSNDSDFIDVAKSIVDVSGFLTKCCVK